MMVESRRSEELVDPLLEVEPSSRALKQALLVSLRCVDPDAAKRPKMGHVIHMLEADEFPFRDEGVRLLPEHVVRIQLMTESQSQTMTTLVKVKEAEIVGFFLNFNADSVGPHGPLLPQVDFK